MFSRHDKLIQCWEVNRGVDWTFLACSRPASAGESYRTQFQITPLPSIQQHIDPRQTGWLHGAVRYRSSSNPLTSPSWKSDITHTLTHIHFQSGLPRQLSHALFIYLPYNHKSNILKKCNPEFDYFHQGLKFDYEIVVVKTHRLLCFLIDQSGKKTLNVKWRKKKETFWDSREWMQYTQSFRMSVLSSTVKKADTFKEMVSVLVPIVPYYINQHWTGE